MIDLPPLYILRHGETLWNAEGRFQGHLDAPLSNLGRAQAARQGQILDDLGVLGAAGTRVILSPLGRARATWQIISATTSNIAKATRDPRLAEIHMGAWQGCLRSDIAATLADRMPDDFTLSLSAPGGERFDGLAARVAGFLADLRTASPAPEAVICVTHGMTSLALRGQALGVSRAQMAGLGYDQGCVYEVIGGAERRFD